MRCYMQQLNARVCKTLITGSSPVVASKKEVKDEHFARLFFFKAVLQILYVPIVFFNSCYAKDVFGRLWGCPHPPPSPEGRGDLIPSPFGRRLG